MSKEVVTSHALPGFDDVAVGHWTDADARTGCTVVVLPEGSIGSAEVRGGAPATREFDVLAPTATVQCLDAVVLSGGSAFGLAVVDGVVSALSAAGRGFPTAGGVVPIVAGMSLFDLAVGSPDVRPGPAQGAAAAEAALAGPTTAADDSVAPAGTSAGPGLGAGGGTGAGSGAGTGAVVSKWRGREHAVTGGLVSATISEGGFTVTALIAVNAFGDVTCHGPADDPWPSLVPPDADCEGGRTSDDPAPFGAAAPSAGENTTLGLIVTDAALSKTECLLMAQGAHDGYARAITPPHCRVDGDAVVAAATGAVPLAPHEDPRRVAQVELLRWLAVRVTADALATLADVAAGGPVPWIDVPTT